VARRAGLRHLVGDVEHGVLVLGLRRLVRGDRDVTQRLDTLLVDLVVERDRFAVLAGAPGKGDQVRRFGQRL
jgi:hypothetical protein